LRVRFKVRGESLWKTRLKFLENVEKKGVFQRKKVLDLLVGGKRVREVISVEGRDCSKEIIWGDESYGGDSRI